MIQDFPHAHESGVSPVDEDLIALLDEAPESARGALHDRLGWLQRLMHWIRWDGSEAEQTGRFAVALAALRENPDWRTSFAAILGSVLSEASIVPLLAEAGLPLSGRLLPEVARRLLRQVEPCPSQGHDLARWLGWTFGAVAEGSFFERMPEGALEEVLEWLEESVTGGVPMVGALRLSFRRQMLDALRLLGADLAAVGVTREMRGLSRTERLSESPCIRLSYELDTLARLITFAPEGEPCIATQISACMDEIGAARRMAGEMHSCLNQFGTSPVVTFQLQRLSAILRRTELILLTLDRGSAEGSSGGPRARGGGEARGRASLDPRASALWLSEAMKGVAEDRRAVPLLMRCLRPWGRKVIERTTAIGRRYVTRNSREHRAMLRSCGGGGLVTAGTVVVKFLILFLNASAFLVGFLVSVNYMISFLVMHALSFRLATKQSSALGSAMVVLLRENANLKRIAHEVASVIRSLLAGILGNVGAVAPAMVAFHFAYGRIAGHPFMDEATARHVIGSLDPVRSLTVPYAILTGGLLWLSSAFAGWMENWAIYRRMPALLRARGGRPGRQISRHVSGVASSVSLGLMLGGVPALGARFGLPLDIRHITLSTGALTEAVCTLGAGPALVSGAGWAVVGLALIGFLNSVVSFTIGFVASVHANGVDRAILSRGFAAIRAEGGTVLRYLLLPPPSRKGRAGSGACRAGLRVQESQR